MSKILYHGTSRENKDRILKEGIKVNVNHGLADFGPGFYLTPNKGVAKNRGECLLAYEFNEKELNGKKFRQTSQEWKEEILFQRVYGKDLSKGFDYVVGPIADGRIKLLAKLLLNGEISKKEFYDSITKGKLSHTIQFAIKTKAAVDKLSRVKEEEK